MSMIVYVRSFNGCVWRVIVDEWPVVKSYPLGRGGVLEPLVRAERPARAQQALSRGSPNANEQQVAHMSFGRVENR